MELIVWFWASAALTPEEYRPLPVRKEAG